MSWLVRAARRSAKEEVRHAHAMASLAVRHGATRPEVKVAPFGARSLEALAIENAVEGCVRETFGALLVLERDAADSLLPGDVARQSGLPSPQMARRLVRELARTCSPVTTALA